MPPTSDEQNAVQYAMLEKALEKKTAAAEVLARALEARAETEGRTLTEDERNLAQKILNAPIEQVIPLESAKLRFFLNHIGPEDWERFRALAEQVARGTHSPSGVEYFINHYQEFCTLYDEWIAREVAAMDPETVSAFYEAWEQRDTDPNALHTIQTVTESFISKLEAEVDRSDE